MSTTARTEREATASPLWPLVVILSDVARRIERHRVAEHAEATPATWGPARVEPAGPGEEG